MKKVLLIIALFVSCLGLNAQNDGDLVIATPTNLKAEAVCFCVLDNPDFSKVSFNEIFVASFEFSYAAI